MTAEDQAHKPLLIVAGCVSLVENLIRQAD